MSKVLKVLIVVVAVLGAGALLYFGWVNFVRAPEQIGCTLEAKQCPDGSYVGRTGANCEFAVCPPTIRTENWKTFSDSNKGVLFKYPETLGTKYVSEVDWPPQAQALNKPFACTEAGLETARAGKTEQKIISSRAYCITKEAGAAAGSVYTQYAYAFSKDNRTVILTFSIRTPQCLNYDDPQKSECQKEQKSFDIDGLVDRIAQTFAFEPVFCTQDAKLCPDGSYVGRIAPKCEFAACPKVKGEGTIKGKVSIGPLCPVEPCQSIISNPYISRSIILKTKAGDAVKTIPLASDGSFSAKIKAGDYVLDLSDCNFLGCRYSLPKEVIITPDKTTEINIDIDTGIR